MANNVLADSFQLLFVFALCGQITFVSCAGVETIKKPSYASFLKKEPLDADALSEIKKTSPKDAVFADLLQAFALIRTADLNNGSIQKEILSLLQPSVSSFEDLADPINFSIAFSDDEDKPFKGRPHERMFAATMTAVLLMAQNKCSQAMPYLRNAEFLDARFQKLPFGTDAPLIYALMSRCQWLTNASANDQARTKRALYMSVRYLSLQKPLMDALLKSAEVDLRPEAVARKMAYLVFEISLYHSLLTAPEDFHLDALIDDAAKNSERFISLLESNFNDEYKKRLAPKLRELAVVYGMNKKKGEQYLKDLAFGHVAAEANMIANNLKKILSGDLRTAIDRASVETRHMTDKILSHAQSDKMILTFSGFAPVLMRQGSYNELAVIKPSADASTVAEIRTRNFVISDDCGFHRGNNDSLTLVLCKNTHDKSSRVSRHKSVELLSMSRKATTVQGRYFDNVLKGRAQFRAATETVAEISLWSAFFLFQLGTEIINDCDRSHSSEVCYSRGAAVLTLAAATGAFSGVAWLIGRIKNPAADSRFIHLMYESVWLSIS